MHTEEQKRLWQKIERKRLSFEGWAVRRFLSALRESTVALIRDVREDPALALSRLDEDVADAPLVSAIRDVYVRVGTDFAQQAYSAFAKADLRDYWLEKMLAMANLRAETVIVGMDATTRERLRSLISRLVSEGEGQEKIIQALRNDYALNRVRARRIARTEIVSVSNYGSLEGAKSAGIPLRKEWISTFDDRAREDHLEMNGTIIDLNETFLVGGIDEMSAPGDWTHGASAASLINCRCSVGYVPI